VSFCFGNDNLRIRVMHRAALGLKQRSARGRAAAPAQNAIATKAKRR
jgi:hypothetical protein